MKVKSMVFAILLLCLVMVGIKVALWNQPERAPDVTFMTITGEAISLRALQGNPVLLTFWATNCKSCLEEIPQLISLHNRFHQQGLQIIALSMHYDLPRRVVNLSKSRRLPYNVALDIGNEYATAFGDVQLIPYSVLISPAGYIDMQITGLLDIQPLTQRIEFFIQG
jgi:peroxiredoxin